MADQKTVQWDVEVLPNNDRRRNASANRPLPSPFPHTNDLTDTEEESSAPKSVLSIDGGGIRGYSSLVILQALMDKIGEIERACNPKATSSIYSSLLEPLDDTICAAPNPDASPVSEYRPCHYFDYIAGTRTGGVIAIMLGRYRMSVSEAMKEYQGMRGTIVKPKLRPRLRRQKSVVSKKHKASRGLSTSTMKLVTALPSPGEDDTHLQSDPERCRTIVCMSDSRIPPFRSYASPQLRPCSIDEVFSQCVGAEPPRASCYDGKDFYKNPSRTALEEVSLHTDHALSGNNNGIDLLSIGGAVTKPVDPKADRLQDMMSRHIERVHQELSTRPRHFNLAHYRRLDALQPIDANDPEPLFVRLEDATRSYLRAPTTAADLHDVATRLVARRRRRARGATWERWALGVAYRCPQPEPRRVLDARAAEAPRVASGLRRRVGRDVVV